MSTLEWSHKGKQKLNTRFSLLWIFRFWFSGLWRRVAVENFISVCSSRSRCHVPPKCW